MVKSDPEFVRNVCEDIILQLAEDCGPEAVETFIGAISDQIARVAALSGHSADIN